MVKTPYEQARDVLIAQGVAEPSEFEIGSVSRLLRFEEAAKAKQNAPSPSIRRAQTMATWLQRNPVLLLLAIVVDIVLVAIAIWAGRSGTAGVPDAYAFNLATDRAAASMPPVEPAEAYGSDVIRRLGEPPLRSDGKTPDAVINQVALESTPETPEVFERCDDRYKVTPAGYELQCTYSSENPYGLMVRYEGTFVLRKGAVVSSEATKVN